MAQLREQKLFEISKDSVNKSLLAAMKFLKYLKSVAKFYDKVIQLYFPQSFDQKSKQKAQQNNAANSGQAGLQHNG